MLSLPASRSFFATCSAGLLLVTGLAFTPSVAQPAEALATQDGAAVEYRLDVLADQALTLDELEETSSSFVLDSSDSAVSGWGATVMLSPGGRDVMIAYGWPEWTNKYPILTTKATYHQQFTCHVLAGTFGLVFTGEYNLEGFRPNKPDWRNSVLSHRCNW